MKMKMPDFEFTQSPQRDLVITAILRSSAMREMKNALEAALKKAAEHLEESGGIDHSERREAALLNVVTIYLDTLDEHIDKSKDKQVEMIEEEFPTLERFRYSADLSNTDGFVLKLTDIVELHRADH